jgi:L-amino acid N-acyltransferase YncA
MLVRDFCESDVGPANALVNEVIAESAIHFSYSPASDEEFRRSWLAGRAAFPWLAAEVDGRFAGYCKAGPWRERDAYRFTVETGIYIVRAFRGRGVGKALYAALFDRLRAAGVHAVIAGVTLPNDASVRLHESVGFRYVGTFAEVGWKFDQWHDVGFWQLHFEQQRSGKSE